mgnify:CR=1 FL=1
MANVLIEGHGTFTVSAEKVQDLVQWLQTNGGVAVEQTVDKRFDGDTLLNETQPGANVGKGPTSDTGPDGKTFDMGGTWM